MTFIFLLNFRPAPENEDEMMEAIFEYIDRIFNIVRPRKLLYMAIDGVVRLSVCVCVCERERERPSHCFTLFRLLELK